MLKKTYFVLFDMSLCGDMKKWVTYLLLGFGKKTIQNQDQLTNVQQSFLVSYIFKNKSTDIYDKIYTEKIPVFI